MRGFETHFGCTLYLCCFLQLVLLFESCLGVPGYFKTRPTLLSPFPPPLFTLKLARLHWQRRLLGEAPTSPRKPSRRLGPALSPSRALFPHLLANLMQAHLSPCWDCGNYTAVDFHASTNGSFEAITNKTSIYSTNIFADVIVDIIDKHDASEPLFIYAPFEAVHGAASCYTDDVRLICTMLLLIRRRTA